MCINHDRKPLVFQKILPIIDEQAGRIGQSWRVTLDNNDDYMFVNSVIRQSKLQYVLGLNGNFTSVAVRCKTYLNMRQRRLFWTMKGNIMNLKKYLISKVGLRVGHATRFIHNLNREYDQFSKIFAHLYMCSNGKCICGIDREVVLEHQPLPPTSDTLVIDKNGNCFRPRCHTMNM